MFIFNYLKAIFGYIVKALAFFVFPSFVTIVLLDLVLGLVGFGYPSKAHYERSDIERAPSVGDTFSGKPGGFIKKPKKELNDWGFLGAFENKVDSVSIAFFGGSTGWDGNPTIVEVIKQDLEEKGIRAHAFNFSSVSSNHTQHLHRLLKFHDRFKFDVVIFYGGGNEVMQYSDYDPRVGYPYNFFFRQELAPILQFLILESSIVGEIELRTNKISGLADLQKTTKTEEWKDAVISNYWKDINVAKKMTGSLLDPNACEKPIFLSVSQPANPYKMEQRYMWVDFMESQKAQVGIATHLDLTSFTRGYSDKIKFTDTIHVDQDSNYFIGNKISPEVLRLLLANCKNKKIFG